MNLVISLSLALKLKLRIPSASQRLLYGGKQLNDSLPLSFYNIEKYALVVLTLRL